MSEGETDGAKDGVALFRRLIPPKFCGNIGLKTWASCLPECFTRLSEVQAEMQLSKGTLIGVSGSQAALCLDFSKHKENCADLDVE